VAQKRRNKKARRKRRHRKLKKLGGICILLAVILLGLNVVLKWTHTKSNVTAEQLEEEGYPESLISLWERNPETEQFVLNYLKYKDRQDEINLSKEVSKGKIPLFLQWDERWGYETYGSDFLAVTGCGPTCLSMVQCGLSGDTTWNPYEVAKMSEQQGFYVDGVGSSWELMTTGAQQIGLTASEVTFDAEHIVAKLNEGNPIICAMGPGDFTANGHFIVLCGVDSDGNIIVNDPNSRINSEKTWDVDVLMSQMKNLWSYSLQDMVN
jgi:hypothetical protein